MQSSRVVHRGGWITGAIAALSVLAGGCQEKQTIILQPSENRPPVIVQQGPATMLRGEPLTTALASSYSVIGDVPYIIVSDPDGVSDIVAVTETIQSLVVRRAVARPDTLDPRRQDFCGLFSYAPADTFDLSAYLKTPPRTIEGLTLSSSSYGSYPYGTPSGGQYAGVAFTALLPMLRFNNDAIGTGQVHFCGLGRVYHVAPPLVPQGRDYLVTHVEIDVIGLTISAYDAGGHTVSATYPTFHVTLLDDGERAVADTFAAVRRHS